MKLAAPWTTYQRKVKALFERDPNVAVGEIYEVSDGDTSLAFDVLVSDPEKYKALDRVMPKVIEFGNVKVGIVLRDMDNPDADEKIELFKAAFKDNPIVKDIRDVEDQAGARHCFIRFVPEVVQFFNDDISDFDGNWSGLAQDIAREVFWGDFCGVHFCTANVKENGGEE